MKSVYWDTMLFVYLFDNHPRFAPRVEQIYRRMHSRMDILCTSPLVFGEVLAGPAVTGDLKSLAAITAFFRSSQVATHSFTMDSVPLFAKLRASGIKTADALHLATAATAGVDLFLTNDTKLTKLALPGLPLIASLETDVI